jgi:adenylate cyclase
MPHMAATLHIASADSAREHTCDRLVTIGRTDTNDVPLKDPKVSRSHAMLRLLADGEYFVVDLGSANGTFLNEKRVVIPVALADGDTIMIGDHTITFHCTEDTVDGTGLAEADMQKTILTMAGVISEITVLVTDIRSYTTLSESVPVDFLATVLGRWFRLSNQIVERYGGVVDKFIGDAAMVRWMTDRRKGGSSVVSAMNTAHSMNLAAEALSKDFPDLPQPLSIGVGITTGQAALANVGVSNSRDYTALGDSVDLAFALESSSKVLKKDVVLDQASYNYLPEDIWRDRLDSVQVKGKDKPVTVCAFSFDEVAQCLPDISPDTDATRQASR